MAQTKSIPVNLRDGIYLAELQLTPQGRHCKCPKDDIVASGITEYLGADAIYTQPG